MGGRRNSIFYQDAADRNVFQGALLHGHRPALRQHADDHPQCQRGAFSALRFGQERNARAFTPSTPHMPRLATITRSRGRASKLADAIRMVVQAPDGMKHDTLIDAGRLAGGVFRISQNRRLRPRYMLPSKDAPLTSAARCNDHSRRDQDGHAIAASCSPSTAATCVRCRTLRLLPCASDAARSSEERQRLQVPTKRCHHRKRLV
jgi:hypothetical protein